MGRRKFYWLIAVILGLGLLWLANRHLNRLGMVSRYQGPANAFAFLWLAGLIVAAYSNPVFKAPNKATRRFKVCLVIPIYNEDPATFAKMLKSLDSQTRQPNSVFIIDDGSANDNCHKVFKRWARTSKLAAKYIAVQNGGKREAQAVGFRANPDADIFVTIDSDTVLDPDAIRQGIMPFTDKRVMSVAGLLVGLNAQANLLTRLVDLGFVSSFLNGRAAWSRVRSVAVNCGGLAFYRANVVNKYLDEYLSQTVFGRKASSGDDRVLTNFALLEGWAIFQETAVGFTLLPEKLSHLTRQRIRWWRSFFWGGLWLLRRFSPARLVWWLVVWQFASFAIYTLVIPIALILNPITYHYLPLAFFGYIMGLSYLRTARYMGIKRPDQKLWQQSLNYLLAPLSSLLHIFLCTVLQYWGLATMAQTGWGTRAKVEVAIE